MIATPQAIAVAGAQRVYVRAAAERAALRRRTTLPPFAAAMLAARGPEIVRHYSPRFWKPSPSGRGRALIASAMTRLTANSRGKPHCSGGLQMRAGRGDGLPCGSPTLALSSKCLARSDKSGAAANATKKRQFRQPKEARKMSIKSVLGVAVILGLACIQAQAGPKRWGDRSSGHDLDAFRYDTREAARLRHKEEVQSRDDGDPNKRWKYDVLFMRRSKGGGYFYVYPTRYGWFNSKDECEQARIVRINRMESVPDDPTAPVEKPVQAWYAENNKEYERTQVAGGGTQSTSTGVSGPTFVFQYGSGGSQSSTAKEQIKGGDQHGILFKPCMPYDHRDPSSDLRPGGTPSPRPGATEPPPSPRPGGTDYQRTENQHQ
jgi:hypothetical protein